MSLSIFERIGHVVGTSNILLALRESHIVKALCLTEGNPLANMFCVTKEPIEQATFKQIQSLTLSMDALLPVVWRVVTDENGNVLYAVVHGRANQEQYTPTAEEVGAKLHSLLANAFPLVDVTAFISLLNENDTLARQFIDSAQQALVKVHNTTSEKQWSIAYVNLGVGENTTSKLQPCVIERSNAIGLHPMLVNETWLHKSLFVDGQPLDPMILSGLKSLRKVETATQQPAPAQNDATPKLPVAFVDSPEGKDGLTTVEALSRIQAKYESRKYSACQFDAKTGTYYFLNGKGIWDAKAYAVVAAYEAIAK